MPADDPLPPPTRPRRSHTSSNASTKRTGANCRVSSRSRALPAPGEDLAGHLESMAAALEAHMSKEEMRLFPMMEQGGRALIGHLIDDLRQHMRAGDAVLFPRYANASRPRASLA